jgi:opacity protein-like surface antigen
MRRDCTKVIRVVVVRRAAHLLAAAMSRLGKFFVIGILLAAGTAKPASAVDMPGDFYLCGSVPSAAGQWNGLYVGGYAGYSRLNSDFSSTNSTISLDTGASATDATFGGFFDYNVQDWDPQLVFGIEFGYNQPL